MKKIIILFMQLTIFCSKSFSQESYSNYKPEDFGLHFGQGGIDVGRMTKKQLDTIIVCPVNYEDQLSDVCIYSNSKKEIVIYRSLGNGFFDIYKTIPLNKTAAKIEHSLPKDYPVFLPPFYGLKITYADGTEQTIYNNKINSFNTETEPKVPKWNFLNDARAFIYDFSFIKTWQSDRNGQAQYTVALGDIDNDGRNEMVYTFYPINDTLPQYRPSRIVVFESVGNSQFIVDWDTILTNGGGNLSTHILTDFDRNGNKEFFGASTDPIFNRGTYGLFECSGERKYRFWGIDEFNFSGEITDVVYLDTMKIIDTTKNRGVWLNGYYAGSPPNVYNKISPYKYSRKYEVLGFGHYEFKTVPNAATNFIRLPFRLEDIEVSDIDRDGKDEILTGSYGQNTINYLDSVGTSFNMGYEYKTFKPAEPISGSWIFTKDMDDDGNNEIICCGIGYHNGSISIVKHTGNPGDNQFKTMWWDTTGLVARPNWGIDTGTINGKFTVLYPAIEPHGPRDIENINTYARNGVYDFYKSSLTILDTTGFIGTKFFDMDMNNALDIVTPIGIGLPPVKFYLAVFEMKDIVTNTYITNTFNISTFKLFQNYPNPFNPGTKINYSIPISSEVKVKIYNILGKEIQTLVNQKQNNGIYEVKFDGSNYPSGIYFYSLIINGNMIDKKTMVYIK